jgi:hypothetical protein
MAAETRWGLAAYGRSGEIEITMDGTTSDPQRWAMTIERKDWSIRFEIASPAALKGLLDFLGAHLDGKVADDFVFGRFQGAPMRMVKDDEFADRFFLVAGGDDNYEFRITLTGASANELSRALTQALADIDEP